MKSDRAAQVLSIGAQDVEPLVRQTAVSAMTERNAAPLLPILARVLSFSESPRTQVGWNM